MDQTMYDNINRLLKDISDDLDLPTDVVKRVYIGSGEDFHNDLAISCINRADEWSESNALS